MTANMTKVVFIGDAKTGKTALVRKLTDLYTPIRYPHIRSRGSHAYTSPSGNKYTLWDTAGKEEYSGLRDGYYTGAHIYIIVGPESTRQYWMDYLAQSPCFDHSSSVYAAEDEHTDLSSILP